MDDDWDLAFGHESGAPFDPPVEVLQGRPKQQDPRGRKKGSYGSSVLKGAVRDFVDNQASQAGTIEYARECRQAKLAQKRTDQMLVKDMTPAPLSSYAVTLDNSSEETKQYVESFGGKGSTLFSVGNSLHHALVDSLAASFRTGLTNEKDDLVNSQLKDAMSHVSARALCKQLETSASSIGARCVSIATCVLLLAGFSFEIVGITVFTDILWELSPPNNPHRSLVESLSDSQSFAGRGQDGQDPVYVYIHLFLFCFL